MQSIDGFGFALTGGSADLTMKMAPEARARLLSDVVRPDGDGAGVSYILLTIGASHTPYPSAEETACLNRAMR